MSEKIFSTKKKDFPIFGKLSEDEYKRGIIDLLTPLKYFSPKIGINWENIEYSKDQIADIVDLIQRRRIYFHIYHSIDMGELNEACLYCFWLLKFKPFHDKTNPNKNVNIVFALALFTRAVTSTANMLGKKPHITKDIMENLLHAFAYRDLSKEAIMIIAESLIG